MSDSLPDARTPEEAAAARLAIRLALGGAALMGVAALWLWTRFGPSMFVDLATAVQGCF